MKFYNRAREMKKLFFAIFFALLFTNCSGTGKGTSEKIWSSRADSSSRSLMSNFWNSTCYYFNESSGADSWGNHYWPQAHALDVLVDAYLRSGDNFYRAYFAQWLEGVHRANGNKY